MLCADDCDQCYNKSFAGSEKAKYWDYSKNSVKPRCVFKSSKTKIWFKCKNGHGFISSLNGVTRGIWCPSCKNKTEQKIYENFTLYKLLTQPKFDWCQGLESNRCLPFDFLIEEHKIILEVDGRQHFEQVSNWGSPEKQQENDKRKMQLANEHGYSVIRILQEDVFYDRINWIYELKIRIESIINMNSQNPERPKENIFIGDDIYNNHRQTFTYNGVECIDDMEYW
jgi:very-short-patch-repair endonuclease